MGPGGLSPHLCWEERVNAAMSPSFKGVDAWAWEVPGLGMTDLCVAGCHVKGRGRL